MPNLKKNVVYSSILTAANYIFPLITYPYVSRVLGVTNIGLCNFTDGIINYFLLFATMGIGIIGIREISSVKNDPEKLNKTFSSLFFLNAISTTIVLVFLIASIFLIPQLSAHKDLMFIGILKLIFNYLLIEWFYKGLEDFNYITNRTIIVKTLYVAAVFLFVRNQDDYVIYYFILTMMIVINAVINICHSRELARLNIRDVSIRPYIKSFFILGIYMMLGSMYTSFNVAYLGFTSGETEVGYYTTATKLYSIMLSIFTAFTGVMMPRMSSLLSENKIEEFRHLFNSSVQILVGITVPLILFSEVFASEIINLVSGRGYEGAIIPMRIILPLMLIIGYEQILIIQTLMPMKKDKAVFINASFGAVIGIFANFILVPQFKAIGSSIVWLISEIVVLISAQYFVSKYTALKFPFKTIRQTIIFNIPFLIIIFILSTLDCISGFSKMLIALLLMVGYTIVVQKYLLKNTLFIHFVDQIINKCRKI